MVLCEEDGADKDGHEATALTKESAFDWIRKTFQNQGEPGAWLKGATDPTHHFPEDAL